LAQVLTLHPIVFFCCSCPSCHLGSRLDPVFWPFLPWPGISSLSVMMEAAMPRSAVDTKMQVPAAVNGDRFAELLHRIAVEHEQQVTSLREQNTELRDRLAQLCLGGDHQAAPLSALPPAGQVGRPSVTSRVRFEEGRVLDEDKLPDGKPKVSTTSLSSSVILTHGKEQGLAPDNIPSARGKHSTLSGMSTVTREPGFEQSTYDERDLSLTMRSYEDQSPVGSHPHVNAVVAAKSAAKTLTSVGSMDASPSSAQTMELHEIWAERRGSIRALVEPKEPEGAARPAARFQRAMLAKDKSAAVRATAAMLWPGIMMHPNAPQRILWDVLGMVLVSYDVVVIPLNAFGPPESGFVDAMTWVTASFWSADILASFVTGFHSDGMVVMNAGEIARHYSRTWLPFDVLLCLVDWALLIARVVETTVAQGDSSVGYARVAARAARFLRVLRLLRLVKLQGVLNEAMERIQSEFWVIMVGVIRLVVFILVLNHMIACVWYWMGTWSLEAYDDSWVKAHDIEDESLQHRYSMALHWSLTQFTPASMEVFPRNEGERFFTILVLLFAMVTFSSFISSITQAMTRLRSLNRDWNEQQAALRRYLCENRVSSELMGRIWGCLDQVMNRSKQRTHEADVAILKLLPWNLRVDLQTEVYEPILGVHPCFGHLMDTYPERLYRVYQQGLQEVSLSSGHELFHTGGKADRMYFIVSGILTYNREIVEHSRQQLSSQDWVSEAALWVKWQHCGQLLSASHCELIALHVGKVADEVVDCGQAAEYAKLFCEYLNSSRQHLTDVICDITALEEMVARAFGLQQGSYHSHSSRRSRETRHTVMDQIGLWSGWSQGRRRKRQFNTPK